MTIIKTNPCKGLQEATEEYDRKHYKEEQFQTICSGFRGEEPRAVANPIGKEPSQKENPICRVIPGTSMSLTSIPKSFLAQIVLNHHRTYQHTPAFWYGGNW